MFSFLLNKSLMLNLNSNLKWTLMSGACGVNLGSTSKKRPLVYHDIDFSLVIHEFGLATIWIADKNIPSMLIFLNLNKYIIINEINLAQSATELQIIANRNILKYKQDVNLRWWPKISNKKSFKKRAIFNKMKGIKTI